MSTMWHGCLADTDYFEMRSSSEHEYGVWVTTPPNYDPGTAHAPVVYVLDGTWAVGMTCGPGNGDDLLTRTRIWRPACGSRRPRWRPGGITGTDL